MSAGKSKKKNTKEHISGRRSAPKQKLFVSLDILAGLAIVVVVLLVVKSGREAERKSAAPG